MENTTYARICQVKRIKDYQTSCDLVLALCGPHTLRAAAGKGISSSSSIGKIEAHRAVTVVRQSVCPTPLAWFYKIRDVPGVSDRLADYLWGADISSKICPADVVRGELLFTVLGQRKGQDGYCLQVISWLLDCHEIALSDR